MGLTDHWTFSSHAEERCAERFGLILDNAARARILSQMESETALRISESTRGKCIYEINLLGRRVIAICNRPRKTVITVMDAKAWYRSVDVKKRRQLYGKAWAGEEE